ncbi:ADP-ribosylglycohydrolase family protein [Thermococcus barophilus]|uniref:ADP-ribosylglycohydrolase n=1 Tax=Thermococcus barophilus (strain DSM 11836 / MP) TaxID=391623 RepID=F0LN70_THEBM|nr:ADP-ribosylglycohydrolase family protein [Thermococcus barophilus]ADT85209.1 ADP-ribosylglycohydrolase [Thermococcus barophilus MP]
MLRSRLEGGLWGVLVGDAFGLTFQFTSRLAMELNYPKPKEIPMLDGLWSDDSSLTLATAHALREGYSIERIAENFLRWYYDGEFTPRGYTFDQGNTTSRAIERIANGVPPLEAGGRGEWDNGNGSLMRIPPAAYYAYFKLNSLEERLKLIHEVSMITHAHPRALIGCGIYSLIVWNILDGMDKLKAYHKAIETAEKFYLRESFAKELAHYERVLSGRIHKVERSEIRGSGYVVHTLEASFWAFLRNESFVNAIKEVISLGEDADTTGAVTGGLAGTYYGIGAIPQEWLEKIEAKEYAGEIINTFIDSLLGRQK